VDSVDSRARPCSRTIPRSIVVPNSGATASANMYGAAMLAGTRAEVIFHVPRDSVSRDGSSADISAVLVALGEGRYEPRAVQPYASSDEGSCSDGLTQADRV